MRCVQFLILIALVHSWATNGYAKNKDIVPWQTDLQTAMKIAEEKNLPILLHFWAPDCGPCLRLEETVFSKSSVAQTLTDYFVPVKVNGTAKPSIRAAYRVERYPTDVILTPNNEVVHRMITPQNPQQYIHQLTAVAFRAGIVPKDSTDQPSGPFARSDRTRYPQDDTASDSFVRAPDAIAQSDERFDRYREQFGKYATEDRLDERLDEAQGADYGSPQPTSGENRRKEVTNPYVSKATADLAATSSRQESVPYQDPSETAGNHQSRLNDQSNPHVSRPTSQANGGRSQVVTNQYVGESRTSTVVPPKKTSPNPPPVALEGYCPVTLLKQEQWKKGNPAFGVIHRGRLFLFAGAKEKKLFLAHPDKFSPVLAGVDPVALTEQGEVIEGKRSHGVVYRDQVFLFANEDNLQKFWEAPEEYTTTILQAMQAPATGRIYR